MIARAADILRALRSAPGGLSQAEVAGQVGLARSAIHRLLSALEDEGLVETGPRGRHRLGPEIGRLADTARRGVISSVHPLLEELSHEVNETADLSVLDRDRATLARELDRVREDGIAYDREEHAEGICAVGTVLPGLAVAVSVPLPAQRFYGREAELRDALLGWATRVEQALGAAVAPAGRRAGQQAGRHSRTVLGKCPSVPRVPLVAA